MCTTHTSRPPRPSSSRAGKALRAAAFLIAASFASTVARADTITDGGDLQRLHPAQTPYGAIGAASADAMTPGAYALRLHLNYARNPLVLLRDGDRIDGTIANNVTAHLTGAYGVTSWFDVALALPLVVFQNGSDSRLNPVGSFAPGDLRVMPRLAILRQWKDGLSLAFTPLFTVPLGGATSLTGDSFLTFSPELTASYRGDRWYGTGSALLRLRREVAVIPGYTSGSEVLIKGGFGYEAAKNLDMIIEGNGGVALSTLTSVAEQPLELNAGVRWYLDPNWSIEGNVGLGILSAPGSPDFRFVVGGTYTNLPPVPPTAACLAHDNTGRAERRLSAGVDTDKDGLDDACDACPAEPESMNGLMDEDGCDDSDRDGDRVLDKTDECPDLPGDAPSGCPDTDRDGLQDRVDECPQASGAPPSGCPDSDGDTILDRDDKCPSVAGVQPTGCPDTDADGLLDTEDRCPNQPGPKPSGCPDSDLDGIADDADKCVSAPEDKDGFEDTDGCPEADNDLDGIADPSDACPDAAEDKDGLADTDGCPETDADEDGVLDPADKCPTEKEVINGVADDDGCPDKGRSLVVVRLDRIEILDKVFFATAKDVIQPQSFGLLKQVAQTIIANPRIGKIRVEGHTDNVGKPASNLDLSRRRAASVVRFLVKEGVTAERLFSEGYGDARPIKPNLTEKNRAENRRVEFVIVGTDATPSTPIDSSAPESQKTIVVPKPAAPPPPAPAPSEELPLELELPPPLPELDFPPGGGTP